MATEAGYELGRLREEVEIWMKRASAAWCTHFIVIRYTVRFFCSAILENRAFLRVAIAVIVVNRPLIIAAIEAIDRYRKQCRLTCIGAGDCREIIPLC